MIASFSILVVLGLAAVVFWIAWWLLASLFRGDNS